MIDDPVIVEGEFCLPEGVEEGAFCVDTVCPFTQILMQDMVNKNATLSPLVGCSVSCEPAAENNAHHETDNGASRLRPDVAECADRCDAIECDCEANIVEDTAAEAENAADTDPTNDGRQRTVVTSCVDDFCTFAFNTCGPGETSDTVCRPPTDAAATDASDTASDAVAEVDTGVCSTADDENADGSKERHRAAPGIGRITGRCSTGRGRFALIPVARAGRSVDGRDAAILKPIQISGTGQLADDAWITEATVVSPTAGPVRAIGAGRRYVVRAGELLRPSEVAFDLSPRAQAFLPGQLAGSAPFVAPMISDFLNQGITVDLGWECEDDGRPGVAEALVRRTYAFTPAELGCPVDWPQRFSITLPDSGTDVVSVQLDGRPSAELRSEMYGAHDTDGRGFSFNRMGVSVEGRVIDHTEEFATLRMDKVAYGDVPLCIPGTYLVRSSQ